MAAVDVLATVADRLVGGMMFHSDHADMCIFMGYKHLIKMHEDGFKDDSANLREIRSLCVRRTGLIPRNGRQERTKTLDRLSMKRMDVSDDDRMATLKECMSDWIEWEDGTAEVFRNAAKRLHEMGEMALSMRIAKLADETEDELSRARDLWCRLSATGWDATIA